MDKRLKILLSTAVVLMAGGLLAIMVVFSSEDTSDTTGKAKMVLEINRFDLGDVSMANGKVTKKINIKNEGDADLKISKIISSCMCTTAALEVDGEKSQPFGMLMGGEVGPIGWSMSIPAGKTGTLEIVFDPNAHGPDATGPISREITITSNDGGEKGMINKIRFDGNVTK